MNYQYWQEISFYLDELDKERANFEQNPDSPEVIDATRKTMVGLLENMRAGLEKQLDKHHTSLIMFAIVAAVDEKMQSYHYNASKVRWVPLQKDFYAAYTAGEVFFKSIDEILDDPNTPNIVYQVYYAMLKRGFQGKYVDSKTQINKYLEMLKDKIPVASMAPKVEGIS
ncbi:MAG: DotU family type IV/VI secretion system protein, partial [Parachlamydia sp.]|nr:DotU family type IV/VI secretion system protein [Parachlamydia sp.]